MGLGQGLEYVDSGYNYIDGKIGKLFKGSSSISYPAGCQSSGYSMAAYCSKAYTYQSLCSEGDWQCKYSLDTINYLTSDQEIFGYNYNVSDYIYGEYLKPGSDCISQKGTIFDAAIACQSYGTSIIPFSTPSTNQKMADALYGEDLNKCSGLVDAYGWQAAHCALLALNFVGVGEAVNGAKGVSKLGKLAEIAKGAGLSDEAIDAGSSLLKACGTKVGVDEDIDKKDALALVFGVGEVEAAGIDCSNLANVTNGFKHYPNKNLTWKEIVKSTQGGSAKYLQGLDIKSIETAALKNGIYDGQYVWYKSSDIVGASKGVETQYIRIDISAGTFHGHPVTAQEIKDMAGNNILKELNN